jgi:hypothetical protein
MKGNLVEKQSMRDFNPNDFNVNDFNTRNYDMIVTKSTIKIKGVLEEYEL